MRSIRTAARGGDVRVGSSLRDHSKSRMAATGGHVGKVRTPEEKLHAPVEAPSKQVAGPKGRDMKVCIVGASGKLGTYMIQHCLDRHCEVTGVCRAESVKKLKEFEGHLRVFPGRTNDPDVIRRAVAGCDGVLTVLVPWGVDGYSSGTAQAVLDHAEADARLVFSCGWHITRDGKDRYGWKLRWLVPILGGLARLSRVVDLNDQVEACRRIFASDRRWTVVRGSDLEEGESQGLPVWSRHVGDPVLESNLTRRIDFALFMVEALTNDALVQEAPAIVGRETDSARAHRGFADGLPDR